MEHSPIGLAVQCVTLEREPRSRISLRAWIFDSLDFEVSDSHGSIMPRKAWLSRAKKKEGGFSSSLFSGELFG